MIYTVVAAPAYGYITVVPSNQSIGGIAPGTIRVVCRVSTVVMVGSRRPHKSSMWVIFVPVLALQAISCTSNSTIIVSSVIADFQALFLARTLLYKAIVPAFVIQTSQIAPGSPWIIVRISAKVVTIVIRLDLDLMWMISVPPLT